MRNFVSRGRASRIGGVLVGLGLALSSAPAASAAVIWATPWLPASGPIAVGGTAVNTVRVWVWNDSTTYYYKVTKQTPVNDGGALGVSVTSQCVPLSGSVGATNVQYSFVTTVGQTLPGSYDIHLRLREYSDATCLTTTGDGEDFEQSLDVGATVFVVADNKAVSVGSPAPAYTFTMHSNSPAGTLWTHGAATHYTAPTCGSTYTASTPASASPVAIHCTGGAHRDIFFVAVDGQLTINKLTPAFAFAPIGDKTVGDPDFSVAGNVTLDPDNGGAVTFGEVAGSTGCEVSAAGSIRITGAGTCTVSASVAETATYAAAGPLTRSFTIAEPAATPTATPTATATATATPTPTGMQEVEAVTANPTLRVTPAPTNTGPDAPGTATPIFALLICLAFGALGLLAVTAQRRSIRD